MYKVDKVIFYLNDNPVHTRTEAPLDADYTYTGLSEGTHSLKAEIYSGAILVDAKTVSTTIEAAAVNWATLVVADYVNRVNADYGVVEDNVALEADLNTGTEQDYLDAISIYNPNGGYRTGKIYNVRDTQPRGSYNLINESWNISQGVKVGVTTSVHTEKLFDFPSFKVSENTDTSYHYVWMQTGTIRGDIERTIHVKKGNRRYVYISARDFDDASMVGAEFDLDTGTVVSNNASYTPTITDVGNGWYKITIFVINSQSGFYDIGMKVGMTNTSGVYSYTGTDGYTYMAHAQVTLELGNSGIGVRPYVVNGNGFDLTVTGGGGTRINANGDVENLVWNLLPNSNDVTKWGINYGLTLSQNNQISTITEDTSDGGHYVLQDNVGISNTVGMLRTIEVKKVDARYVTFGSRYGGGYELECAIIDLDTQTVVKDTGSTYTVTSLEDGWIQIKMHQVTGSAFNNRFVIGISNGTTDADMTYVGTGRSLQFRKPQQILGNAEKPYQVNIGTAAYPKIDYSTGRPAFLIEPASTNYFKNSEDVSAWTFYGSAGGTRTLVPDISPNGGAAYVVDFNAGDNRLGMSVGTSGDLIGSIWLASDTPDEYEVMLVQSSNVLNIKVVSVTTEWQRFDVSLTSTGASYFEVATKGNGVLTDMGRPAATGLKVWGAQVELGSKPTSLIPTNGAAVTRTENIHIYDTGVNEPYFQTDKTVYVEFEPITNDGATAIIHLLNTLAAAPRNNFIIRYDNEVVIYERPNNSTNNTVYTGITGGTIKVLFKLEPGQIKIWVNGTLWVWTDGYYQNITNPIHRLELKLAAIKDVRVLPWITDQEAIDLTTLWLAYYYTVRNYVNRVNNAYGVIENEEGLTTLFENENLLETEYDEINGWYTPIGGHRTEKIYDLSGNKADLTVTGGGGTRINANGDVESIVWNILYKSNDFETTTWDKNGCTVSGNTITHDAVDSWHYLEQSSTGNINGEISIYVKKVNRRYALLSAKRYANDFKGVIFDFDTNTIVSSGGATNAFWESIGDGWYRIGCIISNSSHPKFVVSMNNDGTPDFIFADDGTGQLMIKNAQQTNFQTIKPFQLTTGTAAYPKIDYNTGKAAFLIEPTRTNRILYSNDFTNAAWVKRNGASITDNYAISPDGTQNASLLTGTGSSSDMYQITSFSYVGVSSIWMKAVSGSPTIRLANPDNGSHYLDVTLNTTWKRYDFYSDSMKGLHFTNFGTSQVLIYEAQGEEYTLTSNISTNGATVTRTASNAKVDIASSSTEDFALYYEGELTDLDDNWGLCFSSSSDNNAGVYLRREDTTGYVKAEFPIDNSSFVTSTVLAKDFHKALMRVDKTNYRLKLTVNGVNIGEAYLPRRAWESFGSYDVNSTKDRNGYGNFKDIRIYKRLITDQEAIDLTTL